VQPWRFSGHEKHATNFLGEGTTSPPQFPCFLGRREKTQRTASVPIENCLTAGVHPNGMCKLCASIIRIRLGKCIQRCLEEAGKSHPRESSSQCRQIVAGNSRGDCKKRRPRGQSRSAQSHTRCLQHARCQAAFSLIDRNSERALDHMIDWSSADTTQGSSYGNTGMHPCVQGNARVPHVAIATASARAFRQPSKPDDFTHNFVLLRARRGQRLPGCPSIIKHNTLARHKYPERDVLVLRFHSLGLMAISPIQPLGHRDVRCHSKWVRNAITARESLARSDSSSRRLGDPSSFVTPCSLFFFSPSMSC